jgi:hypothetical protein
MADWRSPGPRYYALFHDAVTDMVTQVWRESVQVRRHRQCGPGGEGQRLQFSDFDAAIHLIGDLRQLKPDLYINLTTGTWPSPFWLFYADSIWRGGDDTEFAGVGTDRERWITYRDGATYDEIVKRGGCIRSTRSCCMALFSRSRRRICRPIGRDFANEVRSYFGTGTQLQEMYITPSLLTAATGTCWPRRRSGRGRTLRRWWTRTGWAAIRAGWRCMAGPRGRRRRRFFTLRNPSAQAQDFTLDPAQAFELPPEAAQRFSAHSPWAADARSPAIELVAGQPHTFQLAPFQVLTLDAVPQP